MSNAPRVTPNQAIEILVHGLKAGLSFYLEGEPGVGKSSIAAEVARRLEFKLVDRRANNWSPDDAAGTRMQDMATGTTQWFPPEWLPAENGQVEGGYKGTVLFFDELASADDRVRKPLFGCILERRMNNRNLPENAAVIAAGNESESGTMVFELDNATRTRFITLKIIADLDSWMLDYAPKANIHPSVASYLKINIHHFCMTEEALQKNLDIYPNPRSWEHVSKLCYSYGNTPEMREWLRFAVQGKIGVEVGQQFMAIFDTVSEMTNLFDIMKAPKGQREKLWPKTLGQVFALTYSMMNYPTNIKTGEEMMDLCEDFPAKGKTTLPFEEMKAPIREVMLKRLRTAGEKQATLDKVFGAGSRKEVTSILGSGPLIDLTGGAARAA